MPPSAAWWSPKPHQNSPKWPFGWFGYPGFTAPAQACRCPPLQGSFLQWSSLSLKHLRLTVLIIGECVWHAVFFGIRDVPTPTTDLSCRAPSEPLVSPRRSFRAQHLQLSTRAVELGVRFFSDLSAERGRAGRGVHAEGMCIGLDISNSLIMRSTRSLFGAVSAPRNIRLCAAEVVR